MAEDPTTSINYYY